MSAKVYRPNSTAVNEYPAGNRVGTYDGLLYVYEHFEQSNKPDVTLAIYSPGNWSHVIIATSPEITIEITGTAANPAGLTDAHRG